MENNINNVLPVEDVENVDTGMTDEEFKKAFLSLLGNGEERRRKLRKMKNKNSSFSAKLEERFKNKRVSN